MNDVEKEKTLDYLQYYDQESYLFDKVRRKFGEQGYLDAFDFFCIVIWKANRAKSTMAKKVLQGRTVTLDEAVRELTSNIAKGKTAKDRLLVLVTAKFHLPMASAILTVLYPVEFTVYDTRVCGQLGEFDELANLSVNVSHFEELWSRYEEFKRKVAETAPPELSLRDKDRYLFGKSRYEQLTHEISQGFEKDKSTEASQ